MVVDTLENLLRDGRRTLSKNGLKIHACAREIRL
jgi:hypothetical protein